MFENIRSDLRRYCGVANPSWVTKIRTAVDYPGFQATVTYRFGRWIEKRFTPDQRSSPIRAVLMLCYRLCSYGARKLLGIDICLKADIGAGFYIGHFGGVAIRACKIGRHCTVNQRTVIGGIGIPVIGDRVWIGAHARIENDVVVGDHATIAAGAVVRQDVKSRSLVAGNPARVIAAQYDNSGIL